MDKSNYGLLRLELRGDRHTDPRGPAWYDDLTLVFYGADDTERVLVQDKLELAPITEWLLENEPYLREELPLITQKQGETIGQTQRRGYASLTDDIPIDVVDLAASALYQYNSQHNFSFATPGMDVPQLIIGPGNEGIEVCNWIEKDGDPTWRFVFDIDDFYSNLPREERA